MKPRFSFSFRETRFLFLETPPILNLPLYVFLSIFSKTHQFFDFFRKPASPPLTLMRDFSKTHQSSLTLKGGSTSHLGLLPSGKKRKPPYSVLKPLRYKVGGPSEVFASSRAAFCGMRPHGYESLTGCRKAMKPIAARPEPTVTGRRER